MVSNSDIIARAEGDLQRAEAAAARAREALAKAEAEASDLKAFIRTFQRYVEAPLGEQATEHSANTRNVAKVGSRARELVDAAIEAIREAGRPLPIGDALDAVLAKGHVVGGTDQKSNLAGYLSRDPRVVSRGRSVGWDIVETEGAAIEPASEDAAPSLTQGGTSYGATLVLPGQSADIFSPPSGSQAP